MNSAEVRPLVLKPRFQSKPKHPSGPEDNGQLPSTANSGPLERCVGVIDQEGDIVVEDGRFVEALHRSGCFGRLFPESFFRRRKGAVCVSDYLIPTASETKRQLEEINANKIRRRKEADDRRAAICEEVAATSSAAEELSSSVEDECPPIPDERPPPPPKKLKLRPEEALYLSHDLSSITILKDSDSKTAFTSDELLSYFLSRHQCGVDDFLRRYLAYRYYRRKGWIVKDGEQFGVHFVLYESHPAECHSAYGVLVTWPNRQLNWHKLAGHCRTLSTVSKELILCSVHCDPSSSPASIISPAKLDQYPIREMHIKNWFPKGHNHRYDGTSPNTTVVLQDDPPKD